MQTRCRLRRATSRQAPRPGQVQTQAVDPTNDKKKNNNEHDDGTSTKRKEMIRKKKKIKIKKKSMERNEWRRDGMREIFLLLGSVQLS